MEKKAKDLEQQTELDRWKCKDFLGLYEDTSAFVSHKRIFVVGGCGRSGTTLLRVMLDTHSLLACGPESLLFLPIPVKLSELSKASGMPLRNIQLWQQRCASRSEFIVRFQEAYLEIRERNIWGDKTSRNIHRFGSILQHFPNARLIHVVRDPRDVVCSLKTHRKRKIVKGKLIPTGWKMPFDDCIERWLRAMQDAFPLRNHPNYLEVRYEELVLNTVKILSQVCQHIGVHFEQPMLEYHKVHGQSRNPMLFPQNIEATKPLSIKSVGRWKTELKNAEAKEIMRRAGTYATRLGYKR